MGQELSSCCCAQSNKSSMVITSVSGSENTTVKLKDNTERFLRTMAQAGKHDMLLGLIETKHDFDINAQDPSDGNTALHKAATNGHIRAVIVLMENGADCRIQDRTRRTASDVARENGHEQCVLAIDKLKDLPPPHNRHSKAMADAYIVDQGEEDEEEEKPQRDSGGLGDIFTGLFGSQQSGSGSASTAPGSGQSGGKKYHV